MSGYTVTTLSILQTRVQERLLPSFWTSAEITSYINEALRIWNTLTGFQKTTASFGAYTVSPYVIFPTSTISPNTMFVLRIELTNTHLGQIRFSEINNLDQTWFKTIVGNPVYFPNNRRNFPAMAAARNFPIPSLSPSSSTSDVPTSWFHVGMNNLIFYPIPDGFSGKAYVIEATPPLINSDDFVQLGEEDISAIVDYCTFIAHLKEGGVELQSVLVLLKNFLEQAARYNAKILKSALYTRILGLPYQEQERPQQLEQPEAR